MKKTSFRCGSAVFDDGSAVQESGLLPVVPRKSLQLCAQVADVLRHALGDIDESLAGLSIVRVSPAPDASQLLVVLAPMLPGEQVDAPETLERLTRHTGRLRAEVARGINRRRVPRLLFHVLSAWPQEAAE